MAIVQDVGKCKTALDFASELLRTGGDLGEIAKALEEAADAAGSAAATARELDREVRA
jgi:hypothetical protein